MKSRIFISTKKGNFDIYSDENDIIYNVPREYQWAMGMDVESFQNELYKKHELLSWDEEFYETLGEDAITFYSDDFDEVEAFLNSELSMLEQDEENLPEEYYRNFWQEIEDEEDYESY